MDDDKKIDADSVENEINIGGGVDIFQTVTSVDDIEIRSYNDDVLIGDDLTPQDQIKRYAKNYANVSKINKHILMDGKDQKLISLIIENEKKR